MQLYAELTESHQTVL